jgi:hypothetical protein
MAVTGVVCFRPTGVRKIEKCPFAILYAVKNYSYVFSTCCFFCLGNSVLLFIHAKLVIQFVYIALLKNQTAKC